MRSPTRELSLTLEGRNDDATALLALYGLPVLPLGMTGRGRNRHFPLKGTPCRGAGELGEPDGRAISPRALPARRRSAADGLAAKGKVRLEAADLEPWLMTIGVGLPGMGTGMPVAARGGGGLCRGLLVLGGLDGTVGEGAVAGDINAVIKDGKPHLTGQLTLDELDLDRSPPWCWARQRSKAPRRRMVGRSVPAEGGGAVQRRTDIAAATLVGRRACHRLRRQPVAEARRRGPARSPTSRRNSSAARSTGLFELKNNGGTGLFSGQVKLSGADLGAALGEPASTGTGDFSTTLSASGKSVGGLVAALSGSGTAALRSLKIAGVNPEPCRLHRQGGQRSARTSMRQRRRPSRPKSPRPARFRPRRSDMAFTVAGGVLRAPPVTLDNAGSLDRGRPPGRSQHRSGRRRRHHRLRARRRGAGRFGAGRCASASTARSGRPDGCSTASRWRSS